ncbi:Uncharacterised protein [Mycobacterium tuberculosis]|uniref:Uncharacterized protein n=2 Tax=Mycobacterium tuberculosis TaxID=1773 RepID=A0A655JDV8_MYCTX|nr:Uncharacterised protein [Mycobacterium tuberculosis]COX20347.1 Uncharacterised protein [Mycobacterium tuberculosis]
MLTGIWVCSARNSDSNPRCSSAAPSSAGPIPSSVTNVRTPNCMLAPIVLWLQDLHDDTAGRELGQSRIDQQT